MSTIDERTAYLNNPYFTKHIYGDFSPFYVTIAVCTVIGVGLILLNLICCYCSKHKHYWTDRNTGNLWLVNLWSRTPRSQPPIDLTELKDASYFQKYQSGKIFNEDVESAPIHQPHYQYQERPQRPQKREEYVELQKRESDI